MNVNSVIPPANPSKPSERLIAFVTATITITVNGMETQSGKEKPTGVITLSVLIFIPPYKITMRAAKIWPTNFDLNPSPLTSSTNPNTTKIPDPMRTALTNSSIGAQIKIEADAPIAMTTPPIRGVGSK